jgi:hypothetical protein
VVRDTAAVHDQFLVELQGMPSTKEYTSGILEWYRQFG